MATYPNGDRFEGEFKDNNANGKGTLTTADGKKYEGEWKDDYLYEGELKDG